MEVSSMSWDVIEGNWKQFRSRIKEKWGDLSDDDLDAIDGRREELARRIQQRYAIEKDRAHSEIEDWMREPGVLDDWNDRRAILDM
jgi:uncharacterized protein YjbJ (UPF0337 family)